MATGTEATNTEGLRKHMRWVNVVFYIIAIIMNSAQKQIGSGKSLTKISDEWALKITPAGPAFGIWPVIYTLLMLFTIYQALPKKWVPSRNDKLIYDGIGYLFALI